MKSTLLNPITFKQQWCRLSNLSVSKSVYYIRTHFNIVCCSVISSFLFYPSPVRIEKTFYTPYHIITYTLLAIFRVAFHLFTHSTNKPIPFSFYCDILGISPILCLQLSIFMCWNAVTEMRIFSLLYLTMESSKSRVYAIAIQLWGRSYSWACSQKLFYGTFDNECLFYLTPDF